MKINKTVFIPNLLSFMFFLNVFVGTVSYVPNTITKGIYLFIGTVSLFYTLYKKSFKNKNFYIFLCIYTLAFISSYMYNKNSDFIEILWPLGFMSFGYMLANFRMSYHLTFFIYYSYLSFIWLIILLFNDVEMFSSLNGINVNMLLFLSLYYITRDYNNKKIVLIPILFSIITVMFLSFKYLGGRSGTATFIFIFLLFVLSNKFDKKAFKFKYFLILIITVLFFFIQLYGQKILLIIQILTSRGLRSIRYQIWYDYLLQVNATFANILFGAKIKGTDLLLSYSDNLHNSLFMLHAKYGIIMLSIVLFMIAFTLARFIMKKNIVYFILFLSVIFRMLFDYSNFNALLDVLFVYFVFSPYVSKTYITQNWMYREISGKMGIIGEDYQNYEAARENIKL